uniref:ubiquitinyl hydrolase 1 n=1 Tax=Caenorhabditis japonica TaxID=281687 RepID=A0A8R1HVP6_CAEJA
MDVQATMLALQDIFYTLQTTPFTDTDKTSSLVKCLRLNNEQQDSQEFGLKFFNALERCLPDHPNGKEIERRLNKLFTGTICTRITCKCGKTSNRPETAISLTLNIEGHSTLMDALDAYFGEERLDDYKCSDCQKTGDVTKQADYQILPPVIVIQLNRYKYTSKGRQKLKTPMVYPREIAAKAFQRIDQSELPPAAMYDLFAVTIHDGNNAECGHYYDLIKSPLNQKWYQYNDASVEAIAKPPGTEKPTTYRSEKNRKKEKEKTPAEQKHCYGLLYRRRDARLPIAHPKLPPEELIAESKRLIEEQFEGQNKQNLDKSEKRVYDLKRRSDKLNRTMNELETHIDKYTNPNEIAFLPLSLLLDFLACEYEVAKGEKKKKNKEIENSKEEKKKNDEDADLAAAIAASKADQLEKEISSVQPSTSAAEVIIEVEEMTESTVQGDITLQSIADTSIESIAEADESIDMTEKLKDIDIVAIAMEESELPTAPPELVKKRTTRQQNGTPQYVHKQHRSPRKSANGVIGVGHKQPVSSRVAALLSSHEIPICGHGKISIDSILFGDVKAVTRAPAIAMLREYDFRVKLVYENGQRVFPEPERNKEVFVFTAEDICMECVKEMRQEGIFNNRLDDDDKLIRKILKEEKQRCSVKCPTKKPDNYYYVAKSALVNFKKSAQTMRENKFEQLHTKKGTLYIDSITEQKSDSTYPAQVSLKRFRGRPPKLTSEVPEKIRKLDENSFISEMPIESVPEDDDEAILEPETSVQKGENIPTKPVELVDLDVLLPVERIEFNAELRCSHDGINYNQFRLAVSPEEWNILSGYFDECFEVKCGEEVCAECRQQEEDAQTGTDNMRMLVKEMRKRINDTLKIVESRTGKSSEDEKIKYGICSVFIDKLKKLTTRQSTSPPSICQQCLICKHQQPYKGLANEKNTNESHVVGLTEEEWNTFVTEIRNLELAGDEHNVFVEPPPIHISNGQICDMCDQCFEQHIKFTEEQKYTFKDQPIFVKLVNPADEEDIPKANGKSRRGRNKNVYSIKMSSSNKLMDLKVQLYDKTHQLPNDQLLYRAVGGEHFDVSNNQKTLFDLRLSPQNNDNPLILIAQSFSPTSNQTEESGDRVPERGFVDTALAH